MNRFLLLGSTALASLLCALAFIAPNYFGWLILWYSVPVVYFMHKTQKLLFWEILLGILLFWVLHSYALAIMVCEQWSWYGALFFLFLVLYLSLCCSTIAFSTLKIGAYFFKEKILFLCTAAQSLVWYFVSYYAFFIFGNSTGYCLAHPALCLIDTVGMQYIVAYAGSSAAIFCICLCNGLIVYLLMRRKFIPLFTMLFIICLGLSHVSHADTEQSTFAWIAPNVQTDPFSWAAQVSSRLLNIHQSPYDRVTTIIMPESAFPFANAKISGVLQALNQTDVLDKRLFICGCYRNNNEGEIVNSLFFANNDPLIYYYDKKTFFPFTEFLPWQWLTTIKIANQFGKYRPCQRPSSADEPLPDADLFICSDLFFNTHLLAERNFLKTDSIIFISNDSWCNLFYFKELMNRYAWLFAVTHSKNLCYVSHTFGYEYGFLYCKKIHDLN